MKGSDASGDDQSSGSSAAASPSSPSTSGSAPSSESSGSGTSTGETPQKKWVEEQGHWETTYSQVWVPNVVYTSHPRYVCSACGATFDSIDGFYAHSDAMWAQGADHGAYIDDSYETKEDQGHYEDQATGQKWVVDVEGHWE